MTDRNSQYQMFSQNLMQNNLSQQQIPQQAQQQQPPDMPMVPGLTNPEHGRMWQQLQQNQYHSQAGGDMGSAQMSSQMADFARAQGMPHGQGQQPIVQQLQQQFGLPSQRMPVPGPSFHDPQPNQPGQSMMPPNYNNMLMNNSQMKQVANRNLAAHNRQLQLMVAQSQHNHQNPNALEVARMGQHAGQQMNGQPGQNQTNPPDMFSPRMHPNADAMHGSPRVVPQAAQGTTISNGSQPGSDGPRRPPSIAELQERRVYLQHSIAQLSQNIQRFQAGHSGALGASDYMTRLSALQTELKGRQEIYLKITNTLQLMSQQMSLNMSGGNMSHMNPTVSSQSPANVPPQVGQSQAGWTQSNSPPDASFGLGPVTGGQPSAPHQPPQPPLNHQMNPQMTRPPVNPPRSGPTPHQITNGQMPNSMPQNASQQFGFQGSIGQIPNAQSRPENQYPSISPLPKPKFEALYPQWCKSQGTEPNLRVMLSDNRSIDLYQLHVLVMQEGGGIPVNQRDLWPIIGGRLGLVQFPGSDGQSGKSGPGIASQLAHAYQRYLQAFEQAYTTQARLALANQQAGNASHAQGSTPDNLQNPPRMPAGPTAQPAGAGLPDPRVMAFAMRYVNISAAAMKEQGHSQQNIDLVERLRPYMLRWQQQQQRLRAAQEMQAGSGNDQQGLPSGVSAPPLPSQFSGNHSQNASSGTTELSADKPLVARPSVGVAQHRQFVQKDMHQAMEFIANAQQQFTTRRLQSMASLNIPDEQRLEYNKMLEQVHKATVEVQPKLPMYYVVLRDDQIIRKLVANVVSVAHQRNLVSTSSPKYIVDYKTLRVMYNEIQSVNETFQNKCQEMKNANAGLPQNPPPVPNISRPSPGVPSHPHPSQPPLHPLGVPPMSRTASLTAATMPKPNLPVNTPSPSMMQGAPDSTPPSVQNASTPAQNPSTPQTIASPGTPKSPKGKVVPKAKPIPRPRKLSKVAAGPSALPATPPTQESNPPMVAGVKRPHPDDSTAPSGSMPSHPGDMPSPKKIKTEWEGPPSEALVKKQQEIEAIKTEEDATAFFEQMSALMQLSANTDNEVHNDIATTLDMILKAAATDPSDVSYASRGGDAGPSLLSPPQPPPFEEFSEFIDYSHTTLDDEDSDSKAPTPDLLPSSTNPSPDSGCELDLATHSSSGDKLKAEDPGDRLDLMHLGPLKEIDGGESAYYQTDGWKWDTPMQTLDQPWAIYTTS